LKSLKKGVYVAAMESVMAERGGAWGDKTYAREKYELDLPITDLDIEPLEQHPPAIWGSRYAPAHCRLPANALTCTFGELSILNYLFDALS